MKRLILLLCLLPSLLHGATAISSVPATAPQLTNVVALYGGPPNVLTNFRTTLTDLKGIMGVGTNANQFGASSLLTIKDGVMLTNIAGFGTISNNGPAQLGSSLYVTGPQTNLSTIRVDNGANIKIEAGAGDFSDGDFQGAKLIYTEGSNMRESAIGASGSPLGLQVPGAVSAGSVTATNYVQIPWQTLAANLHLNGSYSRWRTNLASGSIAVLVTNLVEGVTYRLDVDATGGDGTSAVTWTGLTSPGPAFPRTLTTYYVEKVGTTTNVYRSGLSSEESPTEVVAGAGSGSTNYTLNNHGFHKFLGSSNVNIVAFMGWKTGGHSVNWGTFSVTNLSAIAWGFRIDQASNAVKWLGSPVTSLPASSETFFSYQLRGSNVFIGASTNLNPVVASW